MTGLSQFLKLPPSWLRTSRKARRGSAGRARKGAFEATD